MNRFQSALLLFGILSFASSGAWAAQGERAESYSFSVEAGKHDRKNTPVRVPISVPENFGKVVVVELSDSKRTRIPAQLTNPALLDRAKATKKNSERKDIWFILPELAAGKTASFTATLKSVEPQSSKFTWKDIAGKYADLQAGGRSVVRYMYRAYEDRDKRHDLNNKPFHHLFDPAGTKLVTKGSGGHYTHHQGLFYGFTRCTLSDGRVENMWYCHGGEHELHTKFLQSVEGNVLGRHRTSIDWNDKKAKPFCREERELTAFSLPGGTLVEFASRLKSLKGTVTLDGDAQHAGFQFRAADEVAEPEGEKLTYFLRPDGKGELGATRNPPRGDPKNSPEFDLPWNVMSFVVGGQRFSAVYIDSPKNPQPSNFSERAYGRFGSWFGKQKLSANGSPLEITYRVWLQRGEMSIPQATALANDFAHPPKVVVVRK